ncbi:hypothetical protein FRC02_007311, partial [Tulasnella sp. 418]
MSSPSQADLPLLPGWAFPAFEFMSVLVLALPLGRWLSLLVIALQTGFAGFLITSYRAELPSQAYLIPCLLTLKIFSLVAWTVFADLKWEVKKTEITFDEQGKEVIAVGAFPGSLSFPRRMLWAWWGAVFNLRGIGYTNIVKGVPPLPRELIGADKRWKYVVSRLKNVFWFYLLVDLASTWMHHVNPAPFQTSGPNHISVVHESQTSFQKSMNVLMYGLLQAYGMAMWHTIFSVLLVALGVANPEDFPRMLGSVRSSYTVRKFWGETWHQLLRQPVSRWGKWIAQKLNFKSGTNASSYTQLYVAFVMSGVIHSLGDRMMIGKSGMGSSMPFFLQQAVAITLEDFVIWLGRRTFGTPYWARWVGYIWVICWFRWSLPG